MHCHSTQTFQTGKYNVHCTATQQIVLLSMHACSYKLTSANTTCIATSLNLQLYTFTYKSDYAVCWLLKVPATRIVNFRDASATTVWSAAILGGKLKLKPHISPSHSIPTSGKQVLVLILKWRTPGMVDTGEHFFCVPSCISGVHHFLVRFLCMWLF